jgi:hypothetical protein
MSSPLVNIFSQIEQLSNYFDQGDLLEGRFENNVDNNPIYIGYTPFPNGDPSEPIWYIQKITYDGQAIIRKQQPDDGPKFTYVWDDRATYFS